jgi:ketosteroid isomerase-like protein
VIAAEDGRAVIAGYLDAAASLDPDAYAEVWASEGRLEMPYHPDPTARVLVGRDAIRARMRTAAGSLAALEWIDPAIRATDRPGEYIVEMTSRATRVDGGAYSNRYVIIAAVEDGMVTLWREYFDPTALAAPG